MREKNLCDIGNTMMRTLAVGIREAQATTRMCVTACGSSKDCQKGNCWCHQNGVDAISAPAQCARKHTSKAPQPKPDFYFG